MKELLGTTKDGQEIYSYTIKNKNGMEAVVMNYGANLLALRIPTANGLVDVETGLEHITDYFNNSCYHGCIVARHANRIGGAAFDLNGKHYELEKNDGNNNLHSGFNPLCDRIYNVDEATDDSVYFTIDSPDMDMGFPGNMHFGVRYRVSDNNSLLIYYDATSDQDTIFNPTSHAYFNLLGHDHNDILTHELFINADKFTYADSASGIVMPLAYAQAIKTGNTVTLKFTYRCSETFVDNTNNNIIFLLNNPMPNSTQKLDVSLDGRNVWRTFEHTWTVVKGEGANDVFEAVLVGWWNPGAGNWLEIKDGSAILTKGA